MACSHTIDLFCQIEPRDVKLSACVDVSVLAYAYISTRMYLLTCASTMLSF